MIQLLENGNLCNIWFCLCENNIQSQCTQGFDSKYTLNENDLMASQRVDKNPMENGLQLERKCVCWYVILDLMADSHQVQSHRLAHRQCLLVCF